MSGLVVAFLATAAVVVARGAGAAGVLARLGCPRPRFEPAQVAARLAGRRADHPVSDVAVADALDAVAASLRSGATVPGAIVEVGTGARTRAVREPADALSAGLPLAEALARWADGASGAVPLAAAALGLAADLGGRAAEAVDGVARTLRVRAAVAAEARALATQATVSVAVLVAAPVLFGALATTVDPRVAGFFATPAGVSCVAAALALDGAGAWWMRRQIRAVR